MKKIMSLMIATVVLLVGCGKETITTGDLYDRLPINGGDDSHTSQMIDEKYFLNGALKEMSEDRVLIDTQEAGLVWVSLEDGLTMNVSLNSIVRVQFNGVIAESYPGQAQGHSLIVVQPFLDNPVYTYEEMLEKLEDQAVYPVVVWNNGKDMVAYAMLNEQNTDNEENMINEFYVYIASLYEETPVLIATVKGQVPDLNWFYDQLEVQTSMGSMMYGPDFQESQDTDVLENGTGSEFAPVEIVYKVEKQFYEDQETGVRIEYYQATDMAGELVQEYVNQSLKEIVDIYGEGYTDTVISANILRQDDYLTLAYEGYNEGMSYEINQYKTIDMRTSTELTVEGIVADMALFRPVFLEKSGYEYNTLEGVSVYMDEENFVFTFVPTDDSAKRVYAKFPIFELAPLLDMGFEMPAS